MKKIKKIQKKGQMKIQQMTFMLVAVAFLFILVGIFFLSIKLYNIRETVTNLEEKNAMLLVSKLADSPEFSCGNSFGGSKRNCIDFDKIIGLKYIVDEDDELWGMAKIELRKIYPEKDVECTEANYPDCGIVTILDKEVNTQPAMSNFVSLCRKEADESKIYDKCELAKLRVSAEQK